MLPFTDQQTLWDWLKAETRHHAAKPEPEVNDKGQPLRWFPVNRATLRDIRHGRSNPDAKLGRSRRQRVSRAQHRIDVRENERQWRQDKRRERRARAAELEAAA
jgi:hypothetical protein